MYHSILKWREKAVFTKFSDDDAKVCRAYVFMSRNLTKTFEWKDLGENIYNDMAFFAALDIKAPLLYSKKKTLCERNFLNVSLSIN